MTDDEVESAKGWLRYERARAGDVRREDVDAWQKDVDDLERALKTIKLTDEMRATVEKSLAWKREMLERAKAL